MEDQKRRIQITHVHKGDATYKERTKWIGLIGEFNLNHQTERGYYSGDFYLDNKEKRAMYFFAIRYKRI